MYAALPSEVVCFGVLVGLYSIYLSLQTFTTISIFQGTFPDL
jgi:hypothetical protein